MKNHNHDLVHQLSELMDSIWRFDEYKKNAEGCKECTALWEKMRRDWEEYEKILTVEIKRHVDAGIFE